MQGIAIVSIQLSPKPSDLCRIPLSLNPNNQRAANVTSAEFAYERDLKYFLVRNLSLIEPGQRLFEEEGITGLEFPVSGLFIDILAVDLRGNLVAIELKVSKRYDRVVAQLVRYMAWIEQNQAESDQQVRGIIIARTISEDLRLACSRVEGVGLFEYELAVSLRRLN